MAVLTHKGVVKKLFSEIGPRFGDRTGGFTRVVKLGSRLGDAAPLSVVMLTESTSPGTEKKKKTAKAPPKTGKPPKARSKEGKTQEKGPKKAEETGS